MLLRRPVPTIAGVLVVSIIAMAAPARASVTIFPSRIVVRTSTVVALVDRDPFRLQIQTPRRARVLAEMTNRRPAAKVLGPLEDPIAPGYDARSIGELYTPLSFLVGSSQVHQYSGSLWGGNLMSGRTQGIEYSDRRVIAVRSRRQGVTLTVSTNDPGGRRLSVDVEPTGRGLIAITARVRPGAGVALIGDAFTSSRSEAFRGFGGRHNGLDQHGMALSSFVSEENLPGTGNGGTPAAILTPNGPSAAYYPQAQFTSSAGYGFLLDRPQLSRFFLGSDRTAAWSVVVAGSSLRYLVAPGRPARATAALTVISGRQPAPPRWALGPMLDRLVKNFGETTADYELQLHQDLVNIDRFRLPLSAYRIEGWGFPGRGNDGLALHSFVDPVAQAAMVRQLRARHIHPLAYLRPWITPGSAPDQAGLTVRAPGGGSYVTTGTAGQRIALVDFTNPAALRYWQREVAKVFSLGFDGFMQDFGEEVLFGMRFHDGESGMAMHNRYLTLYARATRAAISAYERRHRGRRLWFFSRAGYSGTPGSAAYEGANFPGDETTDWGAAAGLASLAPDMLNRAVGGAYGFGTDIGGYFDLNTPPTTRELFLRWAEWAALSPVFRLHGSGLAGTHTPWSFGSSTVGTYAALSRLHQRAAPLILRLWRDADRTGVPPIRPLWLEFPGDTRAAAQQQEWMLGPSVLVAPVVSPGAVSRQVYLPPGCWRRQPRGGPVQGPRTISVQAPLTVLPYFWRCRTHPF